MTLDQALKSSAFDQVLARNETVALAYYKTLGSEHLCLLFEKSDGKCRYTHTVLDPKWNDEQLNVTKIEMARMMIADGAIETDVRAIVTGDWK